MILHTTPTPPPKTGEKTTVVDRQYPLKTETRSQHLIQFIGRSFSPDQRMEGEKFNTQRYERRHGYLTDEDDSLTVPEKGHPHLVSTLTTNIGPCNTKPLGGNTVTLVTYSY